MNNETEESKNTNPPHILVKDLALVAARLMLRRALTAARIDPIGLIGPGRVSIFTAGRVWVKAIYTALIEIVQEAELTPVFACCAEFGLGKEWFGNDDDLAFRDLLLEQRCVFGVTDDLESLGRGFQMASEHVIEVLPPDWSDILEVAKSLRLEPKITLTDELCARINPKDLKLAFGNGAGGDAWVHRLHALVTQPGKKREIPPSKVEAQTALEQIADAMLDRALAENLDAKDALSRPRNAVIITTPSTSWTGPLVQAVRRAVEEADRSNVDIDELDLAPPFGSPEVTRHWVTRDGAHKPPTPHRRDEDQGEDRVVAALEDGYTAIGIAPNPSVLPSALINAADHHIRIDTPSWNIIAKAIGGDGDLPDLLEDRLCRVLSPDDFRIALRKGEAPSRAVERLRKIAEQQAGSSATGPTLMHLHGMDEAVEWGQALARDLKGYSRGELHWKAVDRGALLYGSPGVGKTIYAKALARTCDVPIITGSLAEWQGFRDGCLGDCLNAMRRTFEKARAAAPAVLFIDELDSFGDRAKFTARNANYSTQVINCFLELLDGVDGREGVVVLGACNYPQRIDPAILRSGRLDRTILVPLPDERGLVGIFRYHLSTDLADANLTPVARRAAGMTGADAERIVRSARRRARVAERELAMEDLLSELDPADSMSDGEQWQVAVHEAGHATVYSVLFPGSVTSAVLTPGERGGRGRVNYDLGAITTASKSLDSIKALLSGRAAESLFTDAGPTAGAGGSPNSDLARATVLAAAYFASFGLDDGSLNWMGEPTEQEMVKVLRRDRELREKVRRLLAAQYDAALKLLHQHRDAVREIARTLLRERTLSGQEIDQIIRKSNSGDRP